MFYLTEVEDYVRVDPKLFGLPTSDSVREQLDETYGDYYEKELGRVISVVEVLNVGEGVIIPGDGAAYYRCNFKLLVWKRLYSAPIGSMQSSPVLSARFRAS